MLRTLKGNLLFTFKAQFYELPSLHMLIYNTIAAATCKNQETPAASIFHYAGLKGK